MMDTVSAGPGTRDGDQLAGLLQLPFTGAFQTTPGGGTISSNAALVAEAIPAALARRVYPYAAVLTVRSVKLASPEAAVLVNVPPSVAEPGFAPNDIVTAFVADVTTLPSESSTATTTGGVMIAPASPLAGWTTKASATAGAGLTVNELLTTLPTPDAD